MNITRLRIANTRFCELVLYWGAKKIQQTLSVSILHPDRYPDRKILVVALLGMLALLMADWLIGGIMAHTQEPGMVVQGVAWGDFARHVLLAMVGALLLYRYVQPLARRSREILAISGEALRENELILQYVGDGVYGLDRQGRMTFVNAAAERMLGYTREYLGQHIVPHIVPNGKCTGCPSIAKERSIFPICCNGVPNQCNNAVFWQKGGHSVEVQCVSVPIREAGQVAGALVVFRERTALKQNDAILARWQYVFAHAGWGVLVYNVEQGQIELVNPAYARMHGYSVEEATGLQVVEFFAEECRGDLDYHVRLIHEKGHHVWETWHVRKDGSRFPVQIDATAVKDEAGKVLYRIVNMQDITARRQAEDVLRESEAHLACAQAQGKLGSWCLDIASGTLEWSAECYRIFGLPQGAPLDYQLFLDCVHPDDRAYVDRAWHAAMAGDPYDIQHRIVADGEVKWVRERAELEFAPDWAPLRGTGTAQDITELKRHEDALLRSRQDLRELAAHHERIREEERTRIAREIHDELGQCLTALRMDAAMIGIRFGEGNPVLEHQVAWMKKTIDTTIDVVRNLATTLRPGALDMGLVSAAEWLLSGFEERAKIRCRLHAPREHPELDEERSTAAFRILQESLTNIARHAQAAEVNVHIELVDGALEMDIRDDGVGFDHAEVQSRKTFGLMGMRERALQFGGEARIDSTPGSGTTIRIRIPCTKETLDDPHPHWR
jgi:PAS domain S-box-containing protein